MNLIMFGYPGSGKGTQARLLAADYNLSVVDTGLLLRTEVKKISLEEYKAMNKGNLLTDSVVINTVQKYLLSLELDFILDGFPRTMQQALALEEILIQTGRKLSAVIQLAVNEETILARLANRILCSECGASLTSISSQCPVCGSLKLEKRKDDNLEAIKERIKQHNQQEKKLLEFYKKQLIIIDGEHSVSLVNAAIKDQIKNITI